ncbi:hypothetical protein NDU88_006157 [Pleurodeles waltl]|uniref:Secreted protein n=1 Tax=Pleurodeles waltl TaxID=8319 RepID=A0AAV7PKN5_PLEWA|nr:hypothetical protein NDU88_006157 [Pleurodeles waltl]
MVQFLRIVFLLSFFSRCCLAVYCRLTAAMGHSSVGVGRERRASAARASFGNGRSLRVRPLGVIPPGKLMPLPLCVSLATNTLRRLTQRSLVSPRRRRC